MFKNNKILILGLARSGYAAALVLVKRGNEVILNDNKPLEKQDVEQVKELERLGVKLIFGSHPDDLLDSSFDYLIKNPGVPIDHKYVLKARELGVKVINEVEMGYLLLPKNITLIGITGTNGKTTTTTLTYNIIKKAFPLKTHLAGNIGYPLCSILDKVKEHDIIVMEVSCQQLENLEEFRPHIGVMTNLSPAHVDFFHSYDAYKKVKAKLFKNQDANDIAILNNDNEEVLNYTKDIKSTKKYFSRKDKTLCYYKDNYIYYDNEKIISSDDIFIKGEHNIENIMAAIMVSKELGITNQIIKEVISEFRGVEHRLEYVDTVKGRVFYNDTEATNIKCTQIALASFTKPIVIFLGGLERGQDFTELNPYINNVKGIIAIGQCRERVLKYGESLQIPTYSYEFLRDGFKKAVSISKSGDIILLSPASASWDQYKECEVRGAEFKEEVKEYKNEN